MTTLDQAAVPPTLDVAQVRRHAASSGPWTRDQIATLAVIDLAAAVLIVVAAWNAHGQHSTARGIAWLLVALLGLGISGTFHAIFLMRSRRVLAVAITLVVGPINVSLRRNDDAVDLAGHDIVHIVGSRRYHRRECAFVLGRTTVAANLASIDGEPCEVCRP